MYHHRRQWGTQQCKTGLVRASAHLGHTAGMVARNNQQATDSFRVRPAQEGFFASGLPVLNTRICGKDDLLCVRNVYDGGSEDARHKPGPRPACQRGELQFPMRRFPPNTKQGSGNPLNHLHVGSCHLITTDNRYTVHNLSVKGNRSSEYTSLCYEHSDCNHIS